MRLGGPLVCLAVVAASTASCASKVGDRGPSRVTTIADDKRLDSLGNLQLSRLCLDVKSVLSTDQKMRSRCAASVSPLPPSACRDALSRCMQRWPVDESASYDDCGFFFQGTHGCGDLSVGEYAACVRERGERSAALAALSGADVCDERVETRLPPGERSAACLIVERACKGVAGQPSLY